MGKIVSNANGASEPDTETITVYMTEDAHEQMLLSEATSTDTSNSATIARFSDIETNNFIVTLFAIPQQCQNMR